MRICSRSVNAKVSTKIVKTRKIYSKPARGYTAQSLIAVMDRQTHASTDRHRLIDICGFRLLARSRIKTKPRKTLRFVVWATASEAQYVYITDNLLMVGLAYSAIISQ